MSFRKRLSVFLCVFLLAAALTLTALAAGAGDTDFDGSITPADARFVLRTAVGLEQPDEAVRRVCDADHNGEIEAADARLVLRAAVGLEEITHVFDGPDCEKTVIKEAGCTEEGLLRIFCVCGESVDETIPAKGHSYGEAVEKTAPGCAAEGRAESVCSACGDVIASVIPAVGHAAPEEAAVEKEATCTEEGLKTKKCLTCGETLSSEVIPAKGHKKASSYTNDKRATCTEEGLRTIRCAVCNEVLSSETVPPRGHDLFGFIVSTAPTCTAAGTEVSRCKNCAYYESRSLAPIGHDIGEWVVTVRPLCESEGERKRECSRCSYSETETVAPAGHVLTAEVTPPNCIEKGYTVFTCSVCGKTQRGDEVAALGHNMVKDDENCAAPSCETEGVDAYVCTVCQKTERRVVPAAGHTAEKIPAVAPSCTTIGYTEGTKCAVCGKIMTAPLSIPAKGHSFDEWKISKKPDCENNGTETRFCLNCKAAESRDIPASGHKEETLAAVASTCTATGLTEGKKCSVCEKILVPQTETEKKPHEFGDWTVITEPKGDEAGLERRTCKNCGASEDHETHCLHEWSSLTVDPTCTAAGYTVYTCALCEYSYVGDHTDPLGHDYSVLKQTVPPTCEKGGYSSYGCSRCEESEIRDLTDPAGHSFGEWTVLNAAGCLTNGTEQRKCKNCTAAEVREIKAPGHDMISSVTAPTCTEKGFTLYQCSRCEANYKDDYTESLGHIETDMPPVDATCLAEGRIGGTYCSRCRVTLTEPDTVPKTAHTMGQKTTGAVRTFECSVCGYIESTEYAVAKYRQPDTEGMIFDFEKEVSEFNKDVKDEKDIKETLVTLLTDYEIKSDLTVPKGVTLLIPCMDNDAGYMANGYNPDGTTANPSGGAVLYRTLTVPAGKTVTVYGTLLINAVTGRTGSGNRHNYDISGGYAEIALAGGVNVENGGVIDVSGMVEGKGTVTLKDGAAMYETYAVQNWRGGSFASAVMGENALSDQVGTFPITESDMNNMRAKLVVNSGATLAGTVKVYAAGAFNYCRFEQVGANAIYRLEKGAALTRTVTENNGVLKDNYSFSGDVTIATSSIVLMGMPVSTDTKGYYNIDGDMILSFSKGTVTVASKILLLPGAKMVFSDAKEVEFTENGAIAYLTEKQYACDGGYPTGRGNASVIVNTSSGSKVPIKNGVKTTEDVRCISVEGYGTTGAYTTVKGVSAYVYKKQ